MAWLLAGIALVAGIGIGLALRPQRRADQPPTEPPDEETERLAAAGRRWAEVAHELGSPLTAILAFSDDLLQAEPTVEQREALLVIRHQARRSRLLLRGLLEAARRVPEEGSVRRARVDPADLVARVARVTERECEVRGLHFECQVVPSAPNVTGDPDALEQVLGNLLQNACQATPRGGRISLAVQVRGRLLEFVVRDNGPGIPDTVFPHIFEPFYSTKPDHEGTGLGLAISQGIVRNHHGILTAENIQAAEGGGARFVVALPFDDRRWRDRDLGSEPGASRLRSPKATLPPPGRRVLIAEDDVPVRTAVRRYLERSGWHVSEVEDGRAALALLLPDQGQPPFDAVICDLHLPGVSGMVVYGRVYAESPQLRARFVLITGDATTPEVLTFMERTGADVLQKPFELEVLATRLEQVVLRPS